MKLAPGSVVNVGKHTVTVERFLAEGGLALVYLARLHSSGEIAVLKSVSTNTPEGAQIMKNEVEYMRMFTGHKNIVRFFDAEFVSHQGQHTFILMEYCQGGHVVDLMNSRLYDRLKEREILKIFSDACEGVAQLHYAQPPVIHRDIKVENLLVSNSDDYKLCDFGSATSDFLLPRSSSYSAPKIKLDMIHEDVQKHTTLQYRAPELCDVYSGKGINEKIDIWALGVMLYKLCYYTTPFEKEGSSTTTAIMSGQYTIPPEPPFSRELISLIQWCLIDNPLHRPTVYQLVFEICRLRGTKCTLDNKYPEQPVPAAVYLTQLANTFASAHQLPSTPPVPLTPSKMTYGANGIPLRAPPPMPSLPVPLDPMRRGRPSRQPPDPPAELSLQPNPYDVITKRSSSMLASSLNSPNTNLAQFVSASIPQGPPSAPPRVIQPFPQAVPRPQRQDPTSNFQSTFTSSSHGINTSTSSQPPFIPLSISPISAGLGILSFSPSPDSSAPGTPLPVPPSTVPNDPSRLGSGGRPKASSASNLQPPRDPPRRPVASESHTAVNAPAHASSAVRATNVYTPPLSASFSNHHHRSPSAGPSSRSNGEITSPPNSNDNSARSSITVRLRNSFGSTTKALPKPGTPGLARKDHLSEQFRAWIDKYFRRQVYKPKYLNRLVTESWRIHLTQPGHPCMSYWLDRIAQISVSNGVLASLRSLILVNSMITHSDSVMNAEIVARRKEVARLAREWERTKFHVIDQFTQTYAQWLVNVLDYFSRLGSLNIEGCFHVASPKEVAGLPESTRWQLANETRELIQLLQPYFSFLFQCGPELAEKYPWDEVLDAVISVLETGFALYMLLMCIMSTLDRKHVKTVSLLNSLQNLSQFIGYLCSASEKSIPFSKAQDRQYVIPKYRPSTDLNAPWTQPSSMLPKISRRLKARGINTTLLPPHTKEWTPPLCRPEYGSVYDAAHRDFAESSDSD